jgi:hypothetical protein
MNYLAHLSWSHALLALIGLVLLGMVLGAMFAKARNEILPPPWAGCNRNGPEAVPSYKDYK